MGAGGVGEGRGELLLQQLRTQGSYPPLVAWGRRSVALTRVFSGIPDPPGLLCMVFKCDPRSLIIGR